LNPIGVVTGVYRIAKRGADPVVDIVLIDDDGPAAIVALDDRVRV
jgi:hypothetical protein